MAYPHRTRARIPQFCGLGFVVLAVLLTGCASNAPSAAIATEVARGMEPLPILHPETVMPLVTKLEVLQKNLPEFAMQQQVNGNEVSVEQYLGFATQSPIVPTDEVRRIALLQAYLRTDPALIVRVEGYSERDGAGSGEALALDRAQALVRALLTDMRIQNKVTAVVVPRSANAPAQAGIIFVDANGLDQMHPPVRERSVGPTE